MGKLVTVKSDIEKTIDEVYGDSTTACSESFRTHLEPKKAMKNRSVPWLTNELTIMRKRLNVLRRKHERTTNNEIFRTLHKHKIYKVEPGMQRK